MFVIQNGKREVNRRVRSRRCAVRVAVLRSDQTLVRTEHAERGHSSNTTNQQILCLRLCIYMCTNVYPSYALERYKICSS